jgi:carboxylesterase
MRDERDTTPKQSLPAALLIHGFNGEPIDMADPARHLGALGFATVTPTLPGHGTTARDLARTGWDDWVAALWLTARELLEHHPRTILVGHSMGAALALHLAAHEPRFAGVAALCPPLRLWPAEVPVVALARHVVPYIPTAPEDIRDHAARLGKDRKAYSWTPLQAVHSLMRALPSLRAELVNVRCPALVVCARHDHVVPVRDGLAVFALLGGADKELVVLERSYHVVTKDLERAIVRERVGAFAQRVTAPRVSRAREPGADAAGGPHSA